MNYSIRVLKDRILLFLAISVDFCYRYARSLCVSNDSVFGKNHSLPVVCDKNGYPSVDLYREEIKHHSRPQFEK